jgi:hypothetical protein
MDDDTQLAAVMAATLAAVLATDDPAWLQGFEEAADMLAKQTNPPQKLFREFRQGLSRCRDIIESLGFNDPAEDRVLVVATLAAQGLATARTLRN